MKSMNSLGFYRIMMFKELESFHEEAAGAPGNIIVNDMHGMKEHDRSSSDGRKADHLH
jgi:hypothetical protein